MKSMADHLSMSKSGISKAVSGLESKCHITIKRPTSKGKGHHNVYTIIPFIHGNRKTQNIELRFPKGTACNTVVNRLNTVPHEIPEVPTITTAILQEMFSERR
jgi:hypothetical protein